jgi:hypothetical protein
MSSYIIHVPSYVAAYSCLNHCTIKIHHETCILDASSESQAESRLESRSPEDIVRHESQIQT